MRSMQLCACAAGSQVLPRMRQERADLRKRHVEDVPRLRRPDVKRRGLLRGVQAEVPRDFELS